MQRNENSMFEVGRPFYDGLKPFGEREDVDSARRGLAEALARAPTNCSGRANGPGSIPRPRKQGRATSATTAAESTSPAKE